MGENTISKNLAIMIFVLLERKTPQKIRKRVHAEWHTEDNLASANLAKMIVVTPKSVFQIVEARQRACYS